MSSYPLVEDLAYWINERWSIFQKKEAGEPKPWTEDEIFQTYKFCNVHRENDRVTRWLKKNWRDPYYDHPNMWIAMCLARMVNWPDTLAEIGFPEEWSPKHVVDVLKFRKERGEKVWTGAYMVTTSGVKVDKDVGVVAIVNRVYEEGREPLPGDTLAGAWKGLQVKGFGPFLAGQVVADLKYTHVLQDATDWWTWAAIGPGSMRGLNRVMGVNPWATVSQEEALDGMRTLHLVVRDLIKDVPELHLQDLQNCLCEFDKYQRVLLGQGTPRSLYLGT